MIAIKELNGIRFCILVSTEKRGPVRDSLRFAVVQPGQTIRFRAGPYTVVGDRG